MPTKHSDPKTDREVITVSEKKRKADSTDAHIAEASIALEVIARDEYTVGWICAVSTEAVAARAFLDERHEGPEFVYAGDNNVYTLGKLGRHNVVIAVLPDGDYGTDSAASVATNMLRSFPNVKIGLLVGIGGGAPGVHDIRLGDIVVSAPRFGYGGVFQYDFGKTIQCQSFEHTRFLNQPPELLRSAISDLRADYEIEGHQIEEEIDSIFKRYPRLRGKYQRPGPDTDKLYKAEISHDMVCGIACSDDPSFLMSRPERAAGDDDPTVHYGLIASANQLMKDALVRDRLAAEKNVLCFEMEAAGLMNRFPCLVVRGICDYSDSHKNKNWQGYAAMTAAAYTKDLLRRIPPNKIEAEKRIDEQVRSVQVRVTRIETNVETLKSRSDSEEFADIRNWLSELKSQEKQNEVLKNHQQGTGGFLLKSQEFINWHEGKVRVLWCVGPPGTGKTVIASIVIHTLIKSFASSQVSVAFLYCAYAERSVQTIDQLLGSIIQQLILQRNLIPEAIREIYNSYGHFKTRPDLAKLSRALDSVISLFPKVFIVVDALDECDDRTRSCLLAQLQRLDARVQLLFTSRHLEGIPPNAAQFKIIAQEDDMRKYLSAQIMQNCGLIEICAKNKDLLNEIPNKIIAKSGGMFLLARLHFDSVASKLRLGTVRKALVTLPDKLNDTYGDAVERIRTGQEKDRSVIAMRTLMVLSYALRPLQLGEIQHALLTMEAETSDTGIDRSDVYDKELLLTICAGIIIIEDGTSTMRFVHHTAETYFESARERLFENAQSEIAQVCLTYLSFKDFENRPCQTAAGFEKRLKSNHLYDYAAKHWGYHAQEASNLLHQVIDFLRDGAKVEASSQALMDMKWHSGRSISNQDGRSEMTGLHLAAYFGLEEAAISLLRNGQRPDAKDCYGRTPLWLAASSLHEGIIKLLLDNGAKPDIRDKNGRTPLSLIAEMGHEDILQLLLKVIEGAGTKSPQSGSRNGVYGQKLPVNSLPACEPFTIDLADSCGKTPLMYAVAAAKSRVAHVLIKNGANVKRLDYERKGVLHHAIVNANSDLHLVESLIRCGAPTKSVDAENMTPLHYTVRHRREDIARSLLWAGVPVDVAVQRRTWIHNAGKHCRPHPTQPSLLYRPNRGLTPLHYAAWAGNDKMVSFFLQHGANPNAVSEYGETPLHLALANVLKGPTYTEYRDDWTDSDWKVEAVLDYIGLDEEREYAAAQNTIFDHRMAVISALFGDSRTNVTITDFKSESALHKVRYGKYGSEAFVERLMQRNLVPSSRCCDNKTPLHLACQARDFPLIHILGSRTSITQCDSSGQNALHLASKSGCVQTMAEVIKICKIHEIDLSWTRDNRQGNALHCYARSICLEERGIQLLLNYGVDCGAIDVDGNLPLSVYLDESIFGIERNVFRLLLADRFTRRVPTTVP